MSYDKRPNRVCLMTENQMNSLVDEHWKLRAWEKHTDANDVTTYTARTWKELIDVRNYKILYGGTPVFDSCAWNGKNLGKRYFVSGAIIQEFGDFEKLNELGFLPLLNFNEAQQFLDENII